MRNESCGQDSRPVGVGQKRGNHVREQNHGQILEYPSHEAIGSPEQQGHDDCGEDRVPDVGRDTSNHLHAIGHAAQIRTDVEDIGNDNERAG